MADGPPSKKLKKDNSTLPECPYGAKCYRKNPQHFIEYSHSAGGSSDSNSTSTSTTDTTTAKVGIDDSNLPPCKYGVNCYRKNLLHFAQFSHPVSDPAKSADGSDTDVVDSDEDGKDKKPEEKKDILNKGLSLMKKFSQMTDDERKELIKRAFEEKLRLEKELDGAKEQMKEKDRELQQMQRKLNNGLLMMDGEEEALKKTETTYFKLMPERAYKEGSASQIHFRLAESQFYRLLSKDFSAKYFVTSVEYVVSPKIVKRFREYQEELRKKRGEEFSYTLLGFHGTQEKNIKPICEGGFKTPGDSGFSHRTDTGYFGAGIYFSEYPSYSMAYIQGASKLMLCQVLPGKVYLCPGLIHGAKLKTGYDAHMSPCKNELVIFKSQAILPCYIIYFSDKVNVNKLQQDGGVSSAFLVDGEYNEAWTKPPSNVFKATTITLCGTFCVSQDKIYKLITQHGGKKGTKKAFDILVTVDEATISGTMEEERAIKKNIPIVTESYVYQCIIKKKKLGTDAFEIDYN